MGPGWARTGIFYKEKWMLLFLGPSGGPSRGTHALLGPSVQTFLRKRPPPHPAGAQARRVYKQVEHKPAKFRTAAAAQMIRAKSDFARAGFHRRAFLRGFSQASTPPRRASVQRNIPNRSPAKRVRFGKEEQGSAARNPRQGVLSAADFATTRGSGAGRSTVPT